MNFEDHLTKQAINENIHPLKAFEIFIKKHEKVYNFVSIINENISHEEDLHNRFIVKSEKINHQNKFLGLILFEREVIYHIIIAKIDYPLVVIESKKLNINIYGQSYYDHLKKHVASFISKHSDLIVNLTMESVIEDFYVYDEVISTDNIWKKFLRIFYKKI
jgi:hypothetical protein